MGKKRATKPAIKPGTKPVKPASNEAVSEEKQLAGEKKEEPPVETQPQISDQAPTKEIMGDLKTRTGPESDEDEIARALEEAKQSDVEQQIAQPQKEPIEAEPAPTIDQAKVPEPSTEKTPEPAKAPEQAQAPEPAKAPEQGPAPEPAKAPEQVPAPEPAKAPEQVPAPEPVKAPEQVPAPEPEKAPEQTQAGETKPPVPVEGTQISAGQVEGNGPGATPGAPAGEESIFESQADLEEILSAMEDVKKDEAKTIASAVMAIESGQDAKKALENISSDVAEKIQKQLDERSAEEQQTFVTEDDFVKHAANSLSKTWYHCLYFLAFKSEEGIATKKVLYDALKDVLSKSPVDSLPEHMFNFGLGVLVKVQLYEKPVVAFKRGGEFRLEVNRKKLQELLLKAGRPLSRRPIVTKKEEKKMISDFFEPGKLF